MTRGNWILSAMVGLALSPTAPATTRAQAPTPGETAGQPSPDEPRMHVASPDYVVAYWYDQNQPEDTFRSIAYDVRKGQYRRDQVERWLSQARKTPGAVAYIKEVYLAGELGANDDEKLDAMIERERQRRINTQRFKVGDRLVVGVLEALPGRPIRDIVREVRPDGTISLEWYGELKVAGLNRAEVKEKLIEHLRRYLSDEILGLLYIDPINNTLFRVDPADSDRVYVEEAPPLTPEPQRWQQEMELKLQKLSKQLDAFDPIGRQKDLEEKLAELSKRVQDLRHDVERLQLLQGATPDLNRIPPPPLTPSRTIPIPNRPTNGSEPPTLSPSPGGSESPPPAPDPLTVPPPPPPPPPPPSTSTSTSSPSPR